MDKNISILIYEKEKDLNSILYQQIQDINYYDAYTANDQKILLELINKIKFNIFILNIENLDTMLNYFLNIILDKNTNIDIIAYYKKFDDFNIINNFNIFLLKKPFRFNTLLTKLDDIKLKKKESNKIIFMKHIEFLPNKKTLFNIKTKNTIHLTEKENNLLNYLYNKRNLELTKNELLTNIWGVTDGVNTHTLETHIYRLKQKLFKLEPNLSFSLYNKNGLYCIKYN